MRVASIFSPKTFIFSFFFFLFFWGGRLPPARQLVRLCLGAKLCILFLLLQFWKELWRFKVKESMFLLKKTKQNRKWKIPRRCFERWTLCVSSYKNRKLKVKLWWVGAHKRKKSALFVTFFCSKKIFFNICVLLQCLMFWTNFQNIYTFEYQKSFPELF